MAGNGYFDSTQGYYLPKSTEDWDYYDASSASVDWDNWTSWDGTPSLPLTFTTEVLDYGSSELLNYLIDVDTNYTYDVTVRYGNALDSAGDIDTPSTVAVTPSQSLDAKKGRYWQFVVSIAGDSAGADIVPRIENIQVSVSGETVQRTITDIDSSTLSGTTGVRQVDSLQGIGTLSSIICQPHLPTGQPYVADSYVASDYFETASTGTETPYIFVNKTTTPPTLNIYDIDTYGKRKVVDCTFDAVAVGLRALSSTADGSIVETV